MSVYGNSEQWLDLLDSLIPDIVKLILAAWQTMPPIAPDSKEDPVSLELCRQLRAKRALSELPLTVHTQTVELSDDADIDDGRIDLTFHPLVPSEEIYFALECKRVNVLQPKGDPKASKTEKPAVTIKKKAKPVEKKIPSPPEAVIKPVTPLPKPIPPPKEIASRQKSAAKPVIGSVFLLYHQACCGQLFILVAESLQVAFKPVPATGAESKLELGDAVLAYPSPLQVVPCYLS